MKTQSRFLSLDVLRGMDIALMIIVNTPGTWSYIYKPFLHAEWHGFTLTDLVFPTFLFIVGNAMAFSMKKYNSASTGIFWSKILKRSLTIFLIGFLLNWFPFYSDGTFESIGDVRVFGVLQRIALCYFLSAILIKYLSVRNLYIVGLILLTGYHVVMLAFGDLTLEGNAALKLDLALLSTGQMYGGEGIPFDPEGILSTFPAVVNVILGFLVARFLIKQGSSYKTLAVLMVWGTVLIFFAFIWELSFPFNKKIWSSSFVLLTSGIDILVLGVLVYVIDILDINRWTYFFSVFGKNPLFIYSVSILLVITSFRIRINGSSLYSWTFENLFNSWLDVYLASFLFSIFYMLICWSIAFILDKKEIYIKV